MPIEKVKTGISGFDDVLLGGLPATWTVLLSGSSGTGKTIFGLQYLYSGITKYNENAVFVACEEPPDKIKKSVEGFGWNLQKLEDDGKLIFINTSDKLITDTGDAYAGFSLGKILDDIEEAVKKIGAKRIVIDPLSALLLQFEISVAVRRALRRIVERCGDLGCTTIITVERPEAIGITAWKNVEDFVLDGVVILSTKKERGGRIRQAEVMKMRGGRFLSGKHPFRIKDDGIHIYPMPKCEMYEITSSKRISSGVKGLDEMMCGGIPSCDCTLVAGSTGCGKTTLGMEFIKEGVEKGENCLFIGFEESAPVLRRNAKGVGFDVEKAENKGKVTIINESNFYFIPEEFLLKVKRLVEEKQVKRVVIDSVTSYYPAFENAVEYRDHLVAMIDLFKTNNITSILISEMSDLFGTFRITNSGTSFIVDNIIILRYVEFGSEMHKAISVLKMRGSNHEKGIRRMTINDRGIAIRDKFKDMEGLLSGIPSSVAHKIEEFFD